MLSNHEIADMNYCRRCINQKYNIHLKRSDVVVLQMMYPCARCGEMKHPVHAVKWNARWKLLFAHARKRKEPEKTQKCREGASSRHFCVSKNTNSAI